MFVLPNLASGRLPHLRMSASQWSRPSQNVLITNLRTNLCVREVGNAIATRVPDDTGGRRGAAVCARKSCHEWRNLRVELDLSSDQVRANRIELMARWLQGLTAIGARPGSPDYARAGKSAVGIPAVDLTISHWFLKVSTPGK